MLDLLPGTWHLIYSSFPMWRKEGISNVTFNYTPEIRNGIKGLTDEVAYFKKDNSKSIKGFDKSDLNDANAFHWRGDGLLMIATSHWRVEWMSEDRSMMIISFGKTLFTPLGVDVLSRSSSPSTSQLSAAMTFIDSDAELKKKANGLFRLPG